MNRNVLLCAIALAASAACAGAQQAAASDAAVGERARPRPLAGLAARRIVVLPAAYLRGGDPMGWAGQVADVQDYLAQIDAELAFAFGERGLGSRWIFPEQLEASTKRNAPYAPDPHALAAQWMRPPVRKNPEQLPEPLGSQLRTIVALYDGAQLLLLPLEVRFEPAGEGMERAVLHLVLLDPRRSRIVWRAEVASDPAPAFSPALAASVAEHVADLVAEPSGT